MKFLIAFALSVATSSAMAATTESVRWRTFLPPNNLQYEKVLEHNDAMNHDEFDAILDRITAVWGPVIEKQGGKLDIHRLWDDTTVNASAGKDGTDWVINAYGGLARRAEMTPDAFTLAICHEMGHLLGGAPFEDPGLAAEGQADYYSALTCVRKVWGEDTVDAWKGTPNASDLPDAVTTDCKGKFNTDITDATCIRTHLAALSVGKLFSHLDSVTMPSFKTPDTTVADTTNVSYASVQCRLDTFRAGALGLDRPTCWYNAHDPDGNAGGDSGSDFPFPMN